MEFACCSFLGQKRAAQLRPVIFSPEQRGLLEDELHISAHFADIKLDTESERV